MRPHYGCSFKSLGEAPLLDSSATSLRCSLAAASLEDAQTGGHRMPVAHSGERKFGELGVQSGTSS